jgi:pyruvate formate lyase activating enzyme
MSSVSALDPRPRRLDPRLAAWLGLVLAGVLLWGGGFPGRWLQRAWVAEDPRVHGGWFWDRACHGVVCGLCPRRCFLPEGMKGWCRVRVNAGGSLYTLVFGRAAAVHVDPIEKKPVFHLLPGSRAFSLATAGCNLRCDFCQNWSLSQEDPESLPADTLLPAQIVAAAKGTGSRSVAYTYSEPVVFYEYMAETARLARAAGLYNVMITAGYIEPEPLRRLLPLLDVIKVDLKSLDPGYYRTVVGGRLEFVQRTLEILAGSGKQLEIVNLLVPGQNDAAEQVTRLSRWVRTRLGPDTPVFFSRFMPCYRMPNTVMTPETDLHAARDLAQREGLRFVYIGNLAGDDGENTYCPNCGLRLVHRVGYAVLADLIQDGHCPRCGEHIPGIWTDTRRPAGE